MAARRGVTGSVLDVHFAAGERIVAAEELHPLLAADHVDLERLGRAARRRAHEEDRRGRLGIGGRHETEDNPRAGRCPGGSGRGLRGAPTPWGGGGKAAGLALRAEGPTTGPTSAWR